MTSTFRARYDGKALIPDEPVDIPLGRRLMIRVEPASERPAGVSGASIARFFGVMSDEDADAISRAIEDSTVTSITSKAFH